MAGNFIPRKDADLLLYSNSFASHIKSDFALFGLDASQQVSFDALNRTWADSMVVISDPATRTPSAIVAKDDARDAMVDNLRELAGIIRNYPPITNEQLNDLGLTVPDDDPTPVPKPTTAPVMSIQSTLGRTVKIRLRDAANPDSRGKPDGVLGATVLTFVGDEAPADPMEWTFFGNTTRTLFDVDFPATIAAGSKVWLVAFWFNTKTESGPSSLPLSTRFADGMAQAA